MFSKIKELMDMYDKWYNELGKINDRMFLPEKSNQFSNPYYVDVPDNWESSPNRIMIIGEEGRGSGNKYNKEEMIKYNRDVRQAKLYGEKNGYEKNITNFWIRFKKVKCLFDGQSCSFIWNEIDKVHKNIGNDCVLNNTQRKYLHSTDTKILAEEIRITKPTMVIFFGWHYISLKEELPELCKLICLDEKNYITRWNNEKICSFLIDGITYILANHPNFKKHEYEDAVINEISKPQII